MKRQKKYILSNELKEKFYIQLYFNLNYDYDKAVGDTRIASIEKNAEFFHIPIDSYVLDEIIECLKK
jgi:hypothetical protein